MRWLVVAVLVACAPTVDGPAAQQRVVDEADARRVTAQLLALPGVTRAEVVLTRPVRDPLATTLPPPPAASVVLVVDDRTDRARVETATKSLVRALAAVDPVVVIEVGVHRPDLASVGPFTVAASSKGPLKAALAIALAVIAALAGWIAWAYRSRVRE